jgi:two-component system OmpR family response regulator
VIAGQQMRVLIVEDDAEMAAFLCRALGESGHDTEVAATGSDAARQIAKPFDAIILDRMIPEMTGLDVLKVARADGVTTPILMLTALGQIEDRVEGLSNGADDYLVKPFAIDELVARLHAIVRRRIDSEARARLDNGFLSMDLLHREVRYRDRVVPLQPREMRLLEVLMRNAGKVVTRAMLLEGVWGFHFDPQTSLVETHMSRLRTKLAMGGARDAIETVRGVGYRLRPAGDL